MSLLLGLFFIPGVLLAGAEGGLLSQPPQPALPGARAAWVGPDINPGSVRLSRREADQLILPQPHGRLSLPSIDRFTGNEESPLEFRPVALFSSGARIRVIADGVEHEHPRPQRQYYLATNGATGIGLSVDPESGQVSGFVSKGGARLQIDGDILTQLRFTAVEEPEQGANSCGNGDHDLKLGASAIEGSSEAMSLSAAEVGGLISYQAVVAIETDSEWLDNFSDDTTQAMQWITDLFVAMNVFYERDVETQLLIGDVTLRTGSDPYSVASDRFAQLNEFGAYWMDNMDGVERQFAAMLSGRSICSGCFSGIAWLDQYCEYGHSSGPSNVAGSFSYNAIGASRTAANTAIYVGHELGHNMGSTHTHCYNPPVDHCYNAENGCYSGTPECPAGGKGTIMSYCHVSGPNGAGCGTSNSQYHPTVQARLESRLATELVAGCILPYTGSTPQPRFSSLPGSGASIQFGPVTVGFSSGAETVQVQNTGDADLTVSCGLSGPGQAAFSIDSCPATVAAGGTVDVTARCAPGAEGLYSADLLLATNDADEPSPSYSLACTGIAPTLDDVIFQSNFEP